MVLKTLLNVRRQPVHHFSVPYIPQKSLQPLNLENRFPPRTWIHPLGEGYKWIMCSDSCEVVNLVKWHQPQLHAISDSYQGCFFPTFSTLIAHPPKLCTCKNGCGSKYLFSKFLVMIETILTLRHWKTTPFMKKKSISKKNHNTYWAQVSTPAWGYHVVTKFHCTPKRVIGYLDHNAGRVYREPSGRSRLW